MADINTQGAVDVIKNYIPKIQIFGSTALGIGSWLILLLIFIIIIVIIVWLYLRNKKFNKKIIVFEKINNRFEASRHDRACEIKIGKAGDTVFYLRKHKKYLPVPQIQSGRRTYWYAIREDGEWINIGMEDVDFKFKQAEVSYLDKEMRYARIALQRNLKERYEKESFMAKYGMWIMNISYIAIIGIMTWLLFDKYLDIAKVTNAGVESSRQVMELAKSILGYIDTIKSGGSGIAQKLIVPLIK